MTQGYHTWVVKYAISGSKFYPRKWRNWIFSIKIKAWSLNYTQISLFKKLFLISNFLSKKQVAKIISRFLKFTIVHSLLVSCLWKFSGLILGRFFKVHHENLNKRNVNKIYLKELILDFILCKSKYLL